MEGKKRITMDEYLKAKKDNEEFHKRLEYYSSELERLEIENKRKYDAAKSRLEDELEREKKKVPVLEKDLRTLETAGGEALLKLEERAAERLQKVSAALQKVKQRKLRLETNLGKIQKATNLASGSGIDIDPENISKKNKFALRHLLKDKADVLVTRLQEFKLMKKDMQEEKIALLSQSKTLKETLETLTLEGEALDKVLKRKQARLDQLKSYERDIQDFGLGEFEVVNADGSVPASDNDIDSEEKQASKYRKIVKENLATADALRARKQALLEQTRKLEAEFSSSSNLESQNLQHLRNNVRILREKLARTEYQTAEETRNEIRQQVQEEKDRVERLWAAKIQAVQEEGQARIRVLEEETAKFSKKRIKEIENSMRVNFQQRLEAIEKARQDQEEENSRLEKGIEMKKKKMEELAREHQDHLATVERKAEENALLNEENSKKIDEAKEAIFKLCTSLDAKDLESRKRAFLRRLENAIPFSVNVLNFYDRKIHELQSKQPAIDAYNDHVKILKIMASLKMIGRNPRKVSEDGVIRMLRRNGIDISSGRKTASEVITCLSKKYAKCAMTLRKLNQELSKMSFEWEKATGQPLRLKGQNIKEYVQNSVHMEEQDLAMAISLQKQLEVAEPAKPAMQRIGRHGRHVPNQGKPMTRHHAKTVFNREGIANHTPQRRR